MNFFKNTTMIITAVGLGACSTTTPVASPAFTPSISSTAQVDASRIYSVTQNGATKVLGTPDGSLLGTQFDDWSTTSLGVAYSTADVTAIGGMEVNAPRATYAGISGNLSTTVPTTASGTYNGQFNASYYRGGTSNQTWWSGGSFTANVDFTNGALTGSGTGNSGGNLTVAGTLEGAQFNGTANFTATDFPGATNVPMTGGFYGANDVVGIFQNGQVAGVFYAQ